jgi:hypothetical protein
MPRPPDLPSAKKLASKHRHGHKMKYDAGCRCWRCRDGNAAYRRELDEKRRLYGPNDLVSTDRVKAHLKYLQTFGMGNQTVAKHAGVAKTGLADILWYGKKLMRRRSEARVLAVKPTLDTLPLHERVPAGETVEQINQLIRWGYSRRLINSDAMGSTGFGLQVRSVRCASGSGKVENVTVKTARKIRDFFRSIVAIRQIWEEKHGHPIPNQYFVYWKKGRRGSDLVRDLECRPFHVGFNFYNLYPPEMKKAMRLANKLKRTLRNRRRQHAKP